MCRRCTSTASKDRTSSSRWSTWPAATCRRSSPRDRWRPSARLKIGIQLCEFLEAADSFTGTLDGRTVHSFLHGDLKPRNIRVLDNDEIKVFDFGIAKALSLSRKVTRNDFGSSAYMSPERIESGNIDAQAEFWAVGVLLYEMVSGVQPFRALDTARLERRIRERRPPAALSAECPAGLQAIIARLLAGAVDDRYRSAQEIREELQRCADGQQTIAEREGWPRRGHDEPATRRTRRPEPESPNRMAKKRRDAPSASVRRSLPRRRQPSFRRPSPAAVEAAAPPVPVKPRPTWRARGRRLVKMVLILIVLSIIAKEIRINIAATALAGVVGSQDLAAINQTWTQYEALVERQPPDGRTSARTRADHPHDRACRRRDREVPGSERHRLGEPVAAGA